MELLKFRTKIPPPTVDGPPVKYGLYPFGDEVLMSVPTFDIILHVLAQGTPEDCEELAICLQRMYRSPFAGLLGQGTGDPAER
jgi:hypothetical protein